jgi:S1-C subfamily serine protease
VFIGASAQDQVPSGDAKTEILNSEAKMREWYSPLANVIQILPAGTQVNVLSSADGLGYYKVEYGNKTGWINEMYFPSYRTKIATWLSGIDFHALRPDINCLETIEYRAGSPKPSFGDMLAGVKYAVILKRPKILGHVPAYNALFEYLQGMGFQVAYMDENFDFNGSSMCETIITFIEFDYDLEKFSNVKWQFFSPCNNYSWEFSSSKVARAGLYDNPQNNFYNVLRSMYGYEKPSFSQANRIELSKRLTCWTASLIKQSFQSGGMEDPVEGIYENSVGSGKGEAKYKLAVKKISGKFYLIYLSGANNPDDWKEGEVKATLEPTATPQFYKADWIMANKSEDNGYYVSFESGAMDVMNSDKSRSLYIKLYPTAQDNIASFSNVPASGTGFALASNGTIVTNYHVIEGAKTIKIRGINGDLGKSYSAKLVASDKNNDLAIIKIDDYSFSSLETIPYIIKSGGANVGEDVFVLGYPLRSTMGDEVKVTNGIISSKTGYDGDVTSYQISAPVQPGNSGGPLFDSQGNVVGIVSAKHTAAENASYAIKVSYLSTLINSLPSPPTLRKTNILGAKSLSQQVESVKKFVYIIEVN